MSDQLQKSNFRNCPHCGTQITPEVRFCPACGERAAEVRSDSGGIPATAYCPDCGALLSSTAQFCPDCGRKRTELYIGLGDFSTSAVSAGGAQLAGSSDQKTSKMKIIVIAIGILIVLGFLTDLVDEDGDENESSTSGGMIAAISPTPTSSPMPTPTMTDEEWDEEYPPLADIRDLVVRPGDWFGDRMQVFGTIATIQVAPVDRIYRVGDRDSREFATIIYLRVDSLTGSSEQVLIGYDGDTEGLYEDSEIIVYGTMVDTDKSGENIFGQEVSVPLITADLVNERTDQEETA